MGLRVIVLADDYLDVRRPGWDACEQAGAVRAEGPFVFLRPSMTPVMEALWRTFPNVYRPPTVGEILKAFDGEVVSIRPRAS